jgi:hypothetical protein
MTRMAGMFTPEELNCVEEIWNAFRDEGEVAAMPSWFPVMTMADRGATHVSARIR